MQARLPPPPRSAAKTHSDSEHRVCLSHVGEVTAEPSMPPPPVTEWRQQFQQQILAPEDPDLPGEGSEKLLVQ